MKISHVCLNILIYRRLVYINEPQARPIENFWGCLAQKVYEGGWEAKTEEQLIRRIQSKIKEFVKKFVESLLEGVKVKFKSIGDNGFFYLEINS